MERFVIFAQLLFFFFACFCIEIPFYRIIKRVVGGFNFYVIFIDLQLLLYKMRILKRGCRCCSVYTYLRHKCNIKIILAFFQKHKLAIYNILIRHSHLAIAA